MAVRLSDEVAVSILVGDEEVTAYFPGYDNPEMGEAIKKLLGGRFAAGKGGRVADRSFEARVQFFNKMCTRLEGVEDGEGQPLAPTVEGWKQKIPPNWKASFATYFEEKSQLSGDDEVN